MPESTLSMAATGDSFITRRLPCQDVEAAKLAALMAPADVRYTNLEVVVRKREGFPSAQSGGTWATVGPESLHDLRAYGFNLLTWANNHTLDYSYGGLAATRKYLDRAGWVHAGAGADLPEAAAPRYLETPSGRVACLAATSSFHESWRAGNPRPDVGGRPGVNPLRFHTVYRVSPERMKHIRELAAATGVNAVHRLRVKEGFLKDDPPGTERLGGTLFECLSQADSGEAEVTRPHVGDLQRMQRGIREARAQADFVCVAVHCHEMKHARKDLPPDFLVEFAHACIDEGADAVVGHGPHVLRGMEIYKNRPIFYSLGNFIFQNETVPYLPADFYEKYGIDADVTTTGALDARSQNGTLGLGVNPKVWHSVVARWSMRAGTLVELELHPVVLGYGAPRHQQGWPRLSGDHAVLEEIAALSHDFGTRLRIHNATAKWTG